MRNRPGPWGRSGRRSRTGCRCWIELRAVSSTGVQGVETVSAPNDHFIAGPDRCVSISGVGRTGELSGSPIIGVWIVSTTRVEWDKDVIVRIEVAPAPDDHFV